MILDHSLHNIHYKTPILLLLNNLASRKWLVRINSLLIALYRCCYRYAAEQLKNSDQIKNIYQPHPQKRCPYNPKSYIRALGDIYSFPQPNYLNSYGGDPPPRIDMLFSYISKSLLKARITLRFKVVSRETLVIT